MSFVDFVSKNWPDLAGWVVLADFVVTAATLLCVMHIKREPMSAIAWCLTVLLLPFFGPLLFLLFGWQTINRPLVKRKNRRRAYRKLFAPSAGGEAAPVPKRWELLAKLGCHADGFAPTAGNAIRLYHDGHPAYDAMIDAIRAANHHVHMEFFIVRPDESGRRFFTALEEACRRGVQVRFVYDSVGSFTLRSSMVKELCRAGAKCVAFLPVLNPAYRMRINLRNHRKILIVDGRTAFTGGLNIGDEYLGLHAKFGHWRDTFLRLNGPAVESLQRVFLEDWHFASNEAMSGPEHFPKWSEPPGSSVVQIVHSGPDAEYKAIRETYFAGILRGKKRVWIASPYFVPDPGLRDALILAARAGVDVRFLGLFRPDKWIPFLAARYYWTEMLAAGVKVYQYARGMMHSKYVLVDGEWASIGTANMDNRSLYLNYEVNAMVYDPAAVAEMEAEFLKDLEWSVKLEEAVFASRPLAGRLAENAARLMSPVL